MHRLFTSFVIAIFTLWILPLGAFIKPYQEALICGGKRAICLCSHKSVKSSPGLMIVNPGVQKESSPGGASHDFIAQIKSWANRPGVLDYRMEMTQSYYFLLQRSLEHVPKV